ncbi:MAG: hypothetical protein U5L11_08395 [Arhodomonas sp.]|nr:hypothetical protein [Arhodomonas sp.]
MAGTEHHTPVYDREQLLPGDRITGPAIIRDPVSTIVIEPGWAMAVSPRNHVVMERIEARPARVAVGTDVDPVMLEVFNNLFMSVAEQMGVTLQQDGLLAPTSRSAWTSPARSSTRTPTW